METLKTELANRYHAKDVNLSVRLKKDIIGGYRVLTESELLDYTLKEQLSELKEYLNG
jgi:F0F1-type ATP synthase delta subunit